MVRHLLLLAALVMGASSAFADGVFMVVKGDVKVEKAGKQTPAKVGMKVMTADTIIAGADSRAKVVMQDKNVLNISPDSKIVIEQYVNNEATGEKNVTLNVLYGKVRSTVNQKYDGEKNTFHVKTPSAVAGVRGTDFISGYQPNTKQASFVTFEGKVEVGQMNGAGKIINSVFVNPGQTTTSSGGAPAAPSNVPKSELAKMNTDSKSDNKNDRLPADTNGGDKVKKDDAKKDDAKKDDGVKKDDAGDKSDKKDDGSKKGSDKGAANGGGNSGRSPASTGGAPSGDAGGNKQVTFFSPSGPSGGEGGVEPPPPAAPPGPPLPPPVPIPATNQFTNLVDPNIIQGGRTKLLVNIIYK